MRLLLTLSPSQMYEDETSGGLFLLLLSSRRLLCRQVGLAGFILHSQVSHFSSCFSFLDDPVCFSQAIHSGVFLTLEFLLIIRPGQMRWLVLASRKGRRVRRRLTPTGEHTIKWGWEEVRKWVRKSMRVRKWVGGGEEKWFQTGESAGGAESWLLVPECFTTSKLLSPSHQTSIWPLVRPANMITSHNINEI